MKVSQRRRWSWLYTATAAVLLAGCGVNLFNGSLPAAPSPTPRPTASRTPTAVQTTTPEGTRPPSGGPVTLTLWLPPQFDPSAGTPAGDLLRARLDQYREENPGVFLQVRLKATSGPGNLLDALAATSAAAPAALPDLVLIAREDLETAALKGVLTPLDGLTHAMEDSDWYNYARQLARLQGSTFGLPFAGDALALFYRPASLQNLTPDWGSILRQRSPLTFPAGDSNALVTLALYQSAGGQFEGAQSRPMISVDALEQVLDLYNNGARVGVFPGWLAQFDTDGQAWQAYRDGRAQMAISWISRYLADLPADTLAAPLPALGQTNLTLATGWLWAVPAGRNDRQMADIALGEWLVESDFLAHWTAASGYLPPRPTALAGWTNPSLQTLVSQVVLSAQAPPTTDVLSSLGPALKEATVQVLSGQSDPVKAAQAAAEKLQNP